MSKSLKKLIDINRLREFKNKLVGTGSAYVQTSAVDQTIAGTKTFSKPIVGSVTGSSGSCTGNAATATRATSADKATNADHATKADSATKATQDSDGNKITTTYSKNGHTHDDRYYTENEVNNLLNGKANTSGTYSSLTVGNAGSATNATYANWLRTSSHSDHLFHTEWDNAGYFWTYVTTGDGGYRAVRVARSDSAASADRASIAGCVQTSDYHEIRFDWDSQVSGCVGLRVDVTDMGGIVTTNRLVSDIRAQWYAAYPDGAEAHNAMWGGRDITAAFNNGTVSANIANGTFKDIFPGDYITKSVTISGKTYTVNWVIADCDYWINKGDQGSGMTTHHVVIVPQVPFFHARMNPTNSTEGGYAGSEMYKKIIPACAAGIVSAFGSDHILTFRDVICNSLDASNISSGITQWTGTPGWVGEWVSVQCNLMSEMMVYGAPICSAGAMDNTIAPRQMSAFRLSEKLINYNRQWWWLRNVACNGISAIVRGVGDAGAEYVTTSFYVRPFALLK